MKALLVVVVIAALTSCKRPEPESAGTLPTMATVGVVRMIDYYPPKQSFRCLAPANWKTEEEEFVGTETAVFRSDEASISIVKNPDGSTKNPEDWANMFALLDPKGRPPALEKTKIDGRMVIQLSRTQPIRKPHSNKLLHEARERHALITVPDGFYQIRLSAPPESYDSALPIFDAIVQSFKPKS